MILNVTIAVLALCVGTMMGILGGGGSIMAVPIFVYLCHVPAKLAIASSLLVVGLTAAIGAVPHYRSHNVDFSRAFVFALFSSAGAYAGTRLSTYLTGDVQLVLFALVMSGAAYFMLRPIQSEAPAISTAQSRMRLVVPAIAVGCITGLVGVGGGFMIVPVLTLLMGMEMRRAVGTSLVVNSGVGAGGYAMQSEIGIQYTATTVGSMTMTEFLLFFMVCTLVGVLMGARFSSRVSEQALKRSFGLFLVVVAGSIIIQKIVAPTP